MSDLHRYIACDLGAGSGRIVCGRIEAGKLFCDEVHRFANNSVKIGTSLRWNVLRLFEEIQIGLRKAVSTVGGGVVAGISVDSWGVDYVLFNEREPMLSLPYNYRDPRTEAVYNATLQRAGREMIFSETGIQFMPINTLYQLIAESERNADLIGVATKFLPIADYLNYLLCGVPRAEESLASTTQLYNPRTRQWSKPLIDAFRLPERIFPEIVPSGTCLGRLLPNLQEETGLGDATVVAGCSHDTGAAVAAVPAEGEDWAFLSSGTWSLLGVELLAPLTGENVRTHNYTNEAGYGRTTRFLKNIVGMWLLQECQRTWQQEGQRFTYDELMELAEKSEPFRSLIHPNAARFLRPGEMPAKIVSYCRETSQLPPETPGQFVRCVLESLTLLYRQTLNEIEQLTGRTIRHLHIVGGGGQSILHNQMTANATGRTVHAGPVEATAIGNILIQAIALGHVASLSAARRIVQISFPIHEYHARQPAEWQRAFERFLLIHRDDD